MKFMLAKWRFGCMLALYTKEGLHAVLLGERYSALVKELNRRFSNVEKACEKDLLPMQALLHYANTLKHAYEGPLDIQGTVFQKNVWRTLSTIPSGKTMSYTEIAKHIGKPNAYRAVANACGANPLPLVIPCHRAIGSNSTGGYRFGISLKHALLALEKS